MKRERDIDKEDLIVENIKTPGVNDIQKEKIAFGAWDNINAVASDIWLGIHRSLLHGYPIFAYKSSSEKSELVQIVIVRYPELPEGVDPRCVYGMGIVTQGWTGLIPYCPLSYIEDSVPADLLKWKIDKNIYKYFEGILKREKDGDN